jgi:hypothetical protein
MPLTSFSFRTIGIASFTYGNTSQVTTSNYTTLCTILIFLKLSIWSILLYVLSVYDDLRVVFSMNGMNSHEI